MTTETSNYKYNIDKMYTYLRGYLVGANLQQSLRALQFAREAHKDQKRKNGTPYIVHPLSMTCYAVALGLRDDNIISTILLHDVAEDCNITIESLPVNDEVKRAVKFMTVKALETDRSKIETKRRYFSELLESKEAIICKAIDRYMNLSDMLFSLGNSAIGKNVAETEQLLLPTLKKAKEKWAELSDILFVLRTNIRTINDILKKVYPSDVAEWTQKYTENKTEGVEDRANKSKNIKNESKNISECPKPMFNPFLPISECRLNELVHKKIELIIMQELPGVQFNEAATALIRRKVIEEHILEGRTTYTERLTLEDIKKAIVDNHIESDLSDIMHYFNTILIPAKQLLVVAGVNSNINKPTNDKYVNLFFAKYYYLSDKDKQTVRVQLNKE